MRSLWGILENCVSSFTLDDLLVLTTGSKEDLRMVKLILYLCEGSSRLEINF